MIKRLLLIATAIMVATVNIFAQGKGMVSVTVMPKEAAIYINNTFSGYGYAGTV